jgi:hypothetical protein
MQVNPVSAITQHNVFAKRASLGETESERRAYAAAASAGNQPAPYQAFSVSRDNIAPETYAAINAFVGASVQRDGKTEYALAANRTYATRSSASSFSAVA